MLAGVKGVLLRLYKVRNAEENELLYPVELLNSISRNASMTDYQLTLKPDFTVMFLRNLQPSNYQINGSLYIIWSMSDSVLFLCAATVKCSNKRFIHSYISCNFGDEDFPLLGFYRTLFLLRVRFAIKKNKAQEQSFGRTLHMELRYKCFKHSQLRAALYKITYSSKIVVCITQDNNSTMNFAYTSVLSED